MKEIKKNFRKFTATRVLRRDLQIQMDSEPFCVLEIWWPISSGFTTGPAFCWNYFSVKVTCEKSSQLPLRVTENEQNHWGWAIPSSGLHCSGEGRTSRGPWMAPTAPHPGTAHLQVGIPLTGLNQSCSHCHCRQWRETGRCGYCFSNQLGWWRWSSLPAVERTECVAFMWLQFVGCVAVLGKLLLNLTPVLVTNGLISSINFYF